jgi:TM2 domain-containing membrane protein YozV
MSDLNTIKSQIPEAVYQKVAGMEPVAQAGFVDEFNRKKKSVGVAYVFWALGSILGLHYLYFGKALLFFLFLITFGGFMIWWLIDLFRVPGIIKNHNKSVALNVLRDIQVLA